MRVVFLMGMGLLLAGCGGNKPAGTPVKVAGTVLLKGKPVDNASVTFAALSGLPGEYRVRAGTTDAQGAFAIDDVYPAEYRVMVQPAAEAPPADFTKFDPGKYPAVVPDSPLKKYGADSPLTVTVDAGKTNFRFDLE